MPLYQNLLVSLNDRALRRATKKRQHEMKFATFRRSSSLPRLWAVKEVKYKRNRNATFMGLPRELRLHIYGYVFDSTLVHVRRPRSRPRSEPSQPGRLFTWSACLKPTEEAMLCTRSRPYCVDQLYQWLLDMEHELENERADIISPIAIMKVSKLIYKETRSVLFECTTVAFNIRDIYDVSQEYGDMGIQRAKKLCLRGTIDGTIPDASGFYVDHREVRFSIDPLRQYFPKLQYVALQIHLPHSLSFAEDALKKMASTPEVKSVEAYQCMFHRIRRHIPTCTRLTHRIYGGEIETSRAVQYFTKVNAYSEDDMKYLGFEYNSVPMFMRFR